MSHPTRQIEVESGVSALATRACSVRWVSAPTQSDSSAPFEADPICVEVERNGLVESVHHARIAITGPDGSLLVSVGAVGAPMYPRSSSKPMQAIGMLCAGLDLDGELLALAAASHSGEEFHRNGVRQILTGCDLDGSALQTPPDYPTDEVARDDWIRSGHGKESIAMNCSGKHAAMIRTAAINGWPIETYRAPEHPVQQAIAATVADLAGEAIANQAIDGCGAPLLAISLTGLARAFGRIAAATAGTEKLLADAYRQHPEWASGTRRDEVALHRAIPGLVGKAGAEAVYAVGLADGRGIAIKVSDGSARARAVLMATVLQALGLDHPTLSEQASAPVLGHGQRVGAVRTHNDLLSWLS